MNWKMRSLDVVHNLRHEGGNARLQENSRVRKLQGRERRLVEAIFRSVEIRGRHGEEQ